MAIDTLNSTRSEDLQSPQVYERLIWVSVPLILSLLPFAPSLYSGHLAGAGPDVINTVWAMWWFQQEWNGAAWAGHSTEFNFPFGGTGAILSPISAILWSTLDSVWGPASATIWSNIILLWMTMIGMMVLSRRIGLSVLASSAAAILLILPRYTVFTLGETGVVGIAILPILLGLYSIIAIVQEDKPVVFASVLAISMALQGLENPYMFFILPSASILGVLVAKKKRMMALGLLSGLGLMAIVGAIHHGASASQYESIQPTSWVDIFGLYFPVVERPWASSSIQAILYPQQVIWPYGSMDSIHIQGREFVGWTGLLLGGMAMIVARKKASVWFGMALIGLVFVTGSDWGGLPSPFALFNSICDKLVRSLSQPSRYFLLYSVGMGICVACSIDWLTKKWIHLGWLAWAFLLGETLVWGGLSLRVPTTALPDAECLSQVEIEGPTLIWPWDGIDDQEYEATLKSRLFQLLHEQPGATIGTGSWPLVGTVFPGHMLRELGWREALEQRGRLDVQQLSDWGYLHVIVDKSVETKTVKIARDEVFGEKHLLLSCETQDVYRLPEKSSDAGAPEHPSIGFQPSLQ